jgi:hypothetical protein
MPGPEEVLFAFFRVMREWEIRAWERSDSTRHDPQKHEEADRLTFQELADIYARFCTGRPKWQQRMSFGSPPEYDPDTIRIEQICIEGARAEITILHQSWPSKGQINVFTLLERDGEWRIDQRKVSLSHGRFLMLPP